MKKKSVGDPALSNKCQLLTGWTSVSLPGSTEIVHLDVNNVSVLLVQAGLDALCVFLSRIITARSRLRLLPISAGGKQHAWHYIDPEAPVSPVCLKPLLPTLKSAFCLWGHRKPCKRRCSSTKSIGKGVDRLIERHFSATTIPVFAKYVKDMSCETEYVERTGLSVPDESDEETDGNQDKATQRTQAPEEDDAKAERTKNNFAEAIFRALKKKNIVVLAIQVPVYDLTQRIISFIDVYANGTIMILEFKTGYDYAYQYAERKMMEPLEDIPCSPKNIHQLQLWWYHYVCTRVYGLCRSDVENALLLRVNAKNTRVKPQKQPDGSLDTRTGDWYGMAK